MRCLTSGAVDRIIKKLLLDTYTHRIKWTGTYGHVLTVYHAHDDDLYFKLNTNPKDRDHNSLYVQVSKYGPSVRVDQLITDTWTWKELTDLIKKKTPITDTENDRQLYHHLMKFMAK